MQPHNPNQSILNQPLGRVAGKLTNSLVVTLVQGNWFYVLSGILMVIGCHQLVRSIMPTGSELVRTTISLGILQAYEILVIATAILIVNKFRMLGDAFVLFLVELALLVDPTFFSNALGTMPDRRGLLVNMACLALVPVKLLILQRFLRVHQPRRVDWPSPAGCHYLPLSLAPDGKKAGPYTARDLLCNRLGSRAGRRVHVAVSKPGDGL